MINGESTFPVGNVLKIFGSEEVGGGRGGEKYMYNVLMMYSVENTVTEII